MSKEQRKGMSQHFYRASSADFMKIPGSPVAYWLGTKILTVFQINNPLSNVVESRCGMNTGDNDLFLRLWHEVSFNKIGFGFKSINNFLESGLLYAPYNKGGTYRKWFGNIEHVIKFNEENFQKLANQGNHLPSKDFYFLANVTWSDVTSSKNGVSFRYTPEGTIFDGAAAVSFPKKEIESQLIGYLNTNFVKVISYILNPTMHFKLNDFGKLPDLVSNDIKLQANAEESIKISKMDWNASETSWEFQVEPISTMSTAENSIQSRYKYLRSQWRDTVIRCRNLEIDNNRILVEANGLQDELDPNIPLDEITLTCNPHYRYGGNRSEEELETLLQCDTLRELVSYAIGCMMGRYSLDKPGLILASQGETLQDYLLQIPSPRFAPDEDAILPLTDQEWFADDATNRFREFIRVVWGDDHLQENLDFVAESLCLHAIKPKRGESALDTIRRYLSTQFFKDHLRTYKKRPIYWLFSSGKHKAFECLVYLHRYNEGTLARMRTEYVIPLSARLNSYAEKLEQAKEAADSTAETKRLEKELATLHNQQAELAEFDEKLRHYADQRISLDLDDGVKVNYGKFGDLLSEVKSITGA